MYKPEVGEECLYKPDPSSDSWWKCKFIGEMGDEYFVLMDEGVDRMPSSTKNRFKPIKSEREENICRMMTEIGVTNNSATYDICNKLYESGYEKQMPYTQCVSIIQEWLVDMYCVTDPTAIVYAKRLAERLGRKESDNV